MTWQDKFSSREEFHSEVKRLVLECGLSYSRAAMAIGHQTTKNQIVRAMQTIQGKTRSTVTFPDSVWPSTPSPNNDAETKVEPAFGPVHLTKIDRGYTHCRAPLWPDFLNSAEKAPPAEHMFCGQKTKGKSAFCEEHHALFFMPETARRKAKPAETKDNSRYFK